MVDGAVVAGREAAAGERLFRARANVIAVSKASSSASVVRPALFLRTAAAYFFFPYLSESVERRWSGVMLLVRRNSPAMLRETSMPSTALMLANDLLPMVN